MSWMVEFVNSFHKVYCHFARYEIGVPLSIGYAIANNLETSTISKIYIGL